MATRRNRSGNEPRTVSNEALTHDVFLSHSAKEKAVRPLAERLRSDRPGIQLSAFILQPVLGAPIKGSLAQFLYINWLPAECGRQAPDARAAKRNRRRLTETADALVRGTSLDGRRLRGEFACPRQRIRVKQRPRLI